jgi:multiple sugar transport system permease protein
LKGDLVTEATLQKILVTLGAIFSLLFCLSPFFYMLLTGISIHPDFLRPDKPFIPTFSHIETILTSESIHFLSFLKNSIVVCSLSACIAVLIASLAAYAVTRLPIPGKKFLMIAILAVSMFPEVSIVNYLFKLMSTIGWINTYPALVFPYVAWTLPLSLWILSSYFSQIPRDLDKAGLVDGCSRLQVLFKVIFPVAAPGIFSTALLAFILAFNEFLFALMLTTDYSARTIPVGIAFFQGLHGQIPWGEIMAAATVTTIPVVILTVIFQRRIIQGLTRGAVKE